jgi:hypothetical protein
MRDPDPEEPGVGPIDAFFAAACFRTRDGRRLVYPWGARARGYEVPSEERYRRLRRSLRASALLAWVATPLVAAATVERFGPLPAVAFALACGLGALARIHRLLRGLPRTDEPFAPEAARRRRYRALRFAHLAALEGGLLALAALALAWRARGGHPLAGPTALGCALLALQGLAVMLRKRRSEAEDPS